MSFLATFFDLVEGSGEHRVLCPFDHHTPDSTPYKEHNPSAHVNLDKNLFHCKACSTGVNDIQFLQRILDCRYLEAQRLIRCFDNNEDLAVWQETTELTTESKEFALSLGISERVINDLHIRTPVNTPYRIAFPVFMYSHLMDVRKYDPAQNPKVKGRQHCPNGLIIPFDIWQMTDPRRVTLICAGEKDMALARTHGFNAITLTGGESTLPRTPHFFTDRKIAICYDNDEAGLAGGKRLALFLRKYTSHIKLVTNFHEICTGIGEDITDFFTKYNGTKEQLRHYIDETPVFEPSEIDLPNKFPIMDLLTASKPENLNKLVRSNIQIVAVSESSFATPSAVVGEKYKLSGEKDTMAVNEMRVWELDSTNAQDILHLIDNNFKEDTIYKNLKSVLRVPQTERCVKINTFETRTVFRSYVTDMFETTNLATQPMEYTAYSLDTKLESGQKYLATYKLVPHPYHGQQLTMIVVDAEQANDSVSNFKVTQKVRNNLEVIKNLEGTVSERISLMTNKIKGLLGYDGNNTLIQTMDLAYHTPLYVNFGNFKNMRAYLDTIIVGESRVGKSSTAETLRNLYGLGVFTSLAGNSATVAGLIGGSNKVSSGFQTRAGIIPQNHKGLIIFEEFGKSNSNIISELTDIRSSNEVRITRVSGTLTLPATVRMIALTNVKSQHGHIKPIASYPHGLSILMELVDTAEDIARYDMIVILPDRGSSYIDPLWQIPEPFPKEVYQDRIRWVWSRTPEQIQIHHQTAHYLMGRANTLNEEFSCHIKIFGTEAWKKLLRVAIAVAGYLVSTTEDYEKIVVLKEHIDFAEQFLRALYDNSTFKLKEYVQHERAYTEVDDDAVANLQDIYNRHPSLILQLEQASQASKNMLAAASGLTNDELNKALNRLTKGLFVRFSNHDIIPTERFRIALSQINRNTFVRRVGE